MPQIPFIPPPQPSGVFQGAVGTGARSAAPVIQARTARDKIAADLQQAAMRISLGRAQLAQQAQISEMELAAKMKIAEQESLRRQSEAATDKAYKDQLVDMRKRGLDMEEQKMHMLYEHGNRVHYATEAYLADRKAGKSSMEAHQRNPFLSPMDVKHIEETHFPTQYGQEDVKVFEKNGVKFTQTGDLAPERVPTGTPSDPLKSYNLSDYNAIEQQEAEIRREIVDLRKRKPKAFQPVKEAGWFGWGGTEDEVAEAAVLTNILHGLQQKKNALRNQAPSSQRFRYDPATGQTAPVQ